MREYHAEVPQIILGEKVDHNYRFGGAEIKQLLKILIQLRWAGSCSWNVSNRE